MKRLLQISLDKLFVSVLPIVAWLLTFNVDFKLKELVK